MKNSLLEPIFFNPVEKEYLWGGKRIHRFKRKENNSKIAESWEISANKNGESVIKNGQFYNLTLRQLFADVEYREKIFGKKTLDMKEFPILIKFIDASKNLSVQVHPNDKYAKRIGLSSGKNEMWYIIDCSPKAELIGGFNRMYNKKTIKDALDNNSIQGFLNHIKINKGDSIYIPAGTVHAILKNCLVCEIQQNSDITYRMYDWNRKDINGNYRELHVKQALDNIKTTKRVKVYRNTNKSKKNIKVKNFNIEEKKIDKEFDDKSNLKTFYAVIIIKGKGKIISENFKKEIKQGDSFIIPSQLGKYKICGKMQFLKVSI